MSTTNKTIEQQVNQEMLSTLDHKIKDFLEWLTKERPYFWSLLAVALIVLMIDAFEKVVSAATSYSIVFDLVSFIASDSAARFWAVFVLCCIEGLKIFVYIKLFIKVFKKGVSVDFFLIFVAVGLTFLSAFISWKGAEPLFQTFGKKTVMIPVDSMEDHLKGQIEKKQSSIAFIQSNSDKTIKYTTNKDVVRLENEISALNDKLIVYADARMKKDDMIAVDHEKTIQVNKKTVRYIALCLNFGSLFLFSPFLAYFLVRSLTDYKKRLQALKMPDTESVQTLTNGQKQVLTGGKRSSDYDSIPGIAKKKS